MYHENYRARAEDWHEPENTEQPTLNWFSASGPGKRGAFVVNRCTGHWICFIRKSDIDSFVDDPYFLRPTVHPEVDISSISRWISTCVATHTDKCVSDAPKRFGDAFPGLHIMRLVDVYQNCLVEVQDLRHYVALSYIWGAVPNFRLTTSNKKQFLLPHSLDKIWRRIPRTIRDAITLVRKLKLRYLWVDTLCLMQNDSQDLDQGVNVMDRVYELSWLTIIAACGHDANAGLPGVQECSRTLARLTIKVNKEISLGVHTALDELVRGTVYNSRAWTYVPPHVIDPVKSSLFIARSFQEHVLTRRALYFVNDMIFFRCLEADYAESCFDQSRSGKPGWNSSLLPSAMYMEDPLVDYSNFLLYYSKRALTEQNDVLRAMAGIIRRLSERLKYRFFEGLPTAALDMFVLFRADCTILQRRPGFPSFSWTGWRGAIIIEHDCEPCEWVASHTWIIWYKRSSSGITSPVWDPAANESLSIDDIKSYGYLERRRFKPPVPLGFPTLRTAPTENLSFSVPSLPYHLLQFWTLAAFYKIAELDAFTGECSLVGKDNNICGNLSLDGSEDTTLFDSVEPIEIILLSELTVLDSYDVLLLEWKGGLAERRGIGTISKSAIENSFSPGPLWKEILLM